MPDIFQRANTRLAGAFSADGGRLSMGNGIPTALVQNITASYMQNVTRLYEIGSQGGGVNQSVYTNVYYVGGRAEGTLGIARVVGPSALLAAYYKKFGDVCHAKDNTLELIFSPLACDSKAFAQYSCYYCVIVQLGISVQSQDLVVNENSQLIFSSMVYKESAAAGGAGGAGGVANQVVDAINAVGGPLGLPPINLPAFQ